MKKRSNFTYYFLFLILILGLIPLNLLASDSGGGGDYDQQIETIFVKDDPSRIFINENLKTYTSLISLFTNFKEMDISFGNELLYKVQRGDPLSGDEVYNLRRTITTYYKINEKILSFAKLYKPILSEVPKDFAQGKARLAAIKSHLIYLSGHLLVLDHLIQMHKIYYETDPLFRRIVKHALLDKENSTTGPSKNLNDLIKMSQYTVEVGDSSEFAQQIILVREIQKELKTVLANNPEALSLLDIVTTNPVATTIAQGKNNFKANYFTFIDTFIDYFNEITGWLSSIFGNIAGSISWRNGHLKNDMKALTFLQNQLKPMDVIFDKSPFVLTDQFIPGYFGHVAIYLGTEAQLRSVDLWNHPSIIPYQNEIKNGNVILESIRSGVHLNSVHGFMNIDTFMLIRKEDGLSSPDALIEQITRGMDQMGKPYDFNFDVQTLDKIVCSELIYIIFGNVHWPTKYRFGRSTIAPDDIAEILFQKASRFKMKTFINSSADNMYGLFTLEKVAYEMGYVSRPNEEGYFKKKTKCYTVASKKPFNPLDPWGLYNRSCQTTYAQDIYEEH
jgi:hypothetical protein